MTSKASIQSTSSVPCYTRKPPLVSYVVGKDLPTKLPRDGTKPFPVTKNEKSSDVVVSNASKNVPALDEVSKSQSDLSIMVIETARKYNVTTSLSAKLTWWDSHNTSKWKNTLTTSR